MRIRNLGLVALALGLAAAVAVQPTEVDVPTARAILDWAHSTTAEDMPLYLGLPDQPSPPVANELRAAGAVASGKRLERFCSPISATDVRRRCEWAHDLPRSSSVPGFDGAVLIDVRSVSQSGQHTTIELDLVWVEAGESIQPHSMEWELEVVTDRGTRRVASATLISTSS